MSKRLLFVTTRLPWPQNSGRKVSLYHYCRGLAERYGYEITLFVFPEWDQPRQVGEKPPFIKSVHFAAPISRVRRCAGLMRAALTGAPLQEALYYSGKNRRKLRALAGELCPDTVIFDMIRLAPYMKDFLGHTHTILDLDDLLSRRYERQLSAPVTDTGIAGHYGGGMPKALERLLCHGAPGRLILKAEQKRLARAEIAYGKKADGVILVSDVERAYFNEKLGEERAVTVPLGVEVKAFVPVAEKRPRTFGFVGNMQVAANVASLKSIVQNVLPHVNAPYTFEVAGPVPLEVREHFKAAPNLTFLGEVPSLAPVLSAWQFTLCPIAFGSGVKTKILEAMAARLPVLTNTVGAEGIGAQNGQEIFVFDDADALANTANRLLDDPYACKAVGHAAAEFVRAQFSWERAFEAFSKLNL